MTRSRKGRPRVHSALRSEVASRISVEGKPRFRIKQRGRAWTTSPKAERRRTASFTAGPPETVQRTAYSVQRPALPKAVQRTAYGVQRPPAPTLNAERGTRNDGEAVPRTAYGVSPTHSRNAERCTLNAERQAHYFPIFFSRSVVEWSLGSPRWPPARPGAPPPPARDALRGVVGPLALDVGPQGLDHRNGARARKRNHMVHAGQRRKDFQPLSHRHEGPARPLEGADGGVVVDPHTNRSASAAEASR